MRVEVELRRKLIARGYADVVIVALSAGEVPAVVYRVDADGGPVAGPIRIQGTVGELRDRIARLPRLDRTARRGDTTSPARQHERRRSS